MNKLSFSGILANFNKELLDELFPRTLYDITFTTDNNIKYKVKDAQMRDIDNNEVRRGDYILYAHDRLGLIYARVIYATDYKVCIYPLHEEATERKSYLWYGKFYLVVEDDVPEKIKSLAGTAKKAAEWWL